MKRHVLLSILIGLTTLHACAAAPPPSAVEAGRTGGVIHLGVQGHAPERRVQAFNAQVASYDVTLTRLESGEAFEYRGAAPGADGMLHLTCGNLPEGRYTVRVAAFDAQAQCLNASGGADTFYPQGLELKAWQSLGSQDAPIVCAVALRPSLTGVTGSAIDLALALQNGELTPFFGTEPPQKAPRPNSEASGVFDAGPLAASVGQLYPAWRATEDGGAYMGPATLTSTTDDPDNPDAPTLTWTITDTAASPPSTRTVKFLCLNDPRGPFLSGEIDDGHHPVHRRWLKLEETQPVSFRRTADPQGTAATRYRLSSSRPAIYDLFIGPSLAEGRPEALLGLTMHLPSDTAKGPSTVIHLERLSR